MCGYVYVKQSLGWSAVFFAASEGYLNITRLLVNAGADVALGDKVVTCFMFHNHCIVSLSHTHTHSHTLTQNNTTALQLAVVHGKTNLYPLLTPAKLQKPIHQVILINNCMSGALISLSYGSHLLSRLRWCSLVKRQKKFSRDWTIG